MKTELNARASRTARKQYPNQLQRHEMQSRHADRAQRANLREQIELRLDAEEFGVSVRKWF